MRMHSAWQHKLGQPVIIGSGCVQARPFANGSDRFANNVASHTRVEGDLKYGAGNWQQGSKEFFVDRLGHAIEHLVLCAWDDDDLHTHLGHAATNIAFTSSPGRTCRMLRWS